jgi:type 1 fimbriae regulatory protein FimB
MKNTGANGPQFAAVGQSPQSVQLEGKTAKRAKRAPRAGELEDAQYMQPEEIAALFRAITSKRDRALFRLVYHRGLRAHEVALIQYSDWRERDGVLYVRRGKGSISREHSLIREELLALRQWIKERGTYPGPMFPSRQGARGVTRSRLDQLIKGYCRAAGIRAEKAHMHALKHSCGTHLSERGNDAAAVQDWLGHRDRKSTDIYMHFSRARREEATARNRDWR